MIDLNPVDVSKRCMLIDFLPSATRGALFIKTAPLNPPQKLFIHGQPVLRGLQHRASLESSLSAHLIYRYTDLLTH
ncbi:MAG: hypothetical protein GTO66_04650 [Candidatus Aminicenantes bacterium]|nr:hypothetical protein [Candidatus Aminicenantes bacterium]